MVREVVVAVQRRHAHQRGAAHAVGPEMRPVDRNAIADRPAEQGTDRYAIGLAGHVEQCVLDRRDRLLIDAAARLAGEHVQVLRDLFVAERVAADQHRREAADHIRQADRAEALVELGPANDAIVGGDLEEGEHAPAGIGLERFNVFDLHPLPLEGSPRRQRKARRSAPCLGFACHDGDEWRAYAPPRPRQNFETRVSFAVMNSSSAGLPACVCSMPRWIAALICAGSVTRSP